MEYLDEVLPIFSKIDERPRVRSETNILVCEIENYVVLIPKILETIQKILPKLRFACRARTALNVVRLNARPCDNLSFCEAKRFSRLLTAA